MHQNEELIILKYASINQEKKASIQQMMEKAQMKVSLLMNIQDVCLKDREMKYIRQEAQASKENPQIHSVELQSQQQLASNQRKTYRRFEHYICYRQVDFLGSQPEENFRECLHIYINNKPVESTKRMKAIFQQLYRDFMIADKTIPFVLMNIEMSHQSYDLKLQADIRKFFFKPEIEKVVYEKIRSLFLQRFNKIQQQDIQEIPGFDQEEQKFQSQEESQQLNQYFNNNELLNSENQYEQYEDQSLHYPKQQIIKVSKSVLKKKLKKLKYRKYPLKRLVNVYVISNSPAVSDDEEQQQLSKIYQNVEIDCSDIEEISGSQQDIKRLKVCDLNMLKQEKQSQEISDGDSLEYDDQDMSEMQSCFSEQSTTATFYPDNNYLNCNLSSLSMIDLDQYFNEQFQIFKSDKSLQFTLEQMVHNQISEYEEYENNEQYIQVSFKRRLRP
ncbi:dna mismatch repair protein [Stylonychia lemnae]|uniref:Dna mismatch repair protein n=1 Tax=Stylonychia lemnae TaxID=5949 RepID=A0A078AAE5_STYLE|nr:dna mismatch repair protein [Stylonychia lemnae]|eukprot:CDW79235.1 dna mismatch repair protein [Stylonychia lemnae]